MIRKIILIGCGNMARVHCEAIASLKEIELQAAVDCDFERAAHFKKTYGFKEVYQDYRKALEKGKYDIAILCNHWYGRFRMLMDCLECGIHVLTEKPMTLLLDEQDAIFAAAKSHNVKVRVGLMERFRPMFKALQADIADAKIGKILQYNFIHHQSSGNLAPDAMQKGWEYQKNLLKGGATPNVDCGIHKCDMVRMLSGADPINVYSIGRRLEADAPSNNLTHSIFQMSDGSILTLEDCFSRNTRHFIHMWLLGDGGMSWFEYAGSHMRPSNGSQEDFVTTWCRRAGRSEAHYYPAAIKPVKEQLLHFIDEIKSNADMSGHYANVAAATTMAISTVLSEQRGAPVQFPLTPADRDELRRVFTPEVE